MCGLLLVGLQWNLRHRLTCRVICRCSLRTTPLTFLARNLIWFPSTVVSTCFPDEARLDATISFVGYAQTTYQDSSLNGESALDLQYSMTLVTGNQPVTLYQAGDMEMGGIVLSYTISDI